jgi:hypothetical protein
MPLLKVSMDTQVAVQNVILQHHFAHHLLDNATDTTVLRPAHLSTTTLFKSYSLQNVSTSYDTICFDRRGHNQEFKIVVDRICCAPVYVISILVFLPVHALVYPITMGCSSFCVVCVYSECFLLYCVVLCCVYLL